MSNRILLAVCALSLMGCAKMVVSKVTGPPVAAEGVIYALPNTVVRTQLKVDRTKIATAPPYSEFAKIFTPGGKPVCKATCTQAEKDAVEFSIQQGATFSTFGEPDPDNVYIAKFTGGGAIDQTLSMTWNETGLLSAASATVTNRTIDIVTSSLKAAAGIGIKAMGLGAPEAIARGDCDGTGDPTDKAVIAILTTAGNAAPSLIKNYCDIEPTERKTFGSDTALLKAAVVAFGPLGQLEVARDQVLVNPNALNPAATVALLDTEIAKLQTQYFLGSKGTTTWEGTLDIRKVIVGDIKLLALQSSKGICLGSAAIPPEAKPIPEGFVIGGADCDAARDVNLKIDYYPARENQLFSKIKDVENAERSFRYRIPAQVSAQVLSSNKSYGKGVFSVAQLGTVVSLPATRRSKTLTYELTFIEATGALKTFKLGTTGGLDSSTIDALSGIAGSALDAKNKADTNASEATALTKEDQLLKLRDDICTIQKKYGLTCTVQPN